MTAMLPFLEVAHLASSSSFYSAILQPLGLQYVHSSAASEADSAAAGPCITYGTSVPPTRVFQLRQVGSPKPSRIVLTAHSAAAVDDFRRFAVRAYPGAAQSTETRDDVARVVDFDGNTMEVVYRPPPSEHGSQYGGSTVRKTQSTSAEANRILNWNYGVAVSSPPTVVRSRPPTAGYAADDEPYRALRRSATTTSVIYEPTPSPRESSSGVSTGTVVGALLGVAAGAAAGAALTYAMVKNDRSRAPVQDFDPPTFTRRSTFPNAPSAEGRSPRYVEVERTVEKVRYPHDYVPSDPRRSPPEYIARYSQVGTSSKPPARELEDIYDDTRGRHSSRHSRTGGSTVRTRSEAATARQPLMLTETEHRSHVGSSASSKFGSTPPITRSTVQRSHTFDVSDRESYASARSHRTHSTIRPSPAVQPAALSVVARSRAGSRVATTTVKMSDSTGPAPLPLRERSSAGSGHRAGGSSYVSARYVPLPPSVAGSSRAGFDDADDADSVVPDDSISCVGSRRGSSRSYYG